MATGDLCAIGITHCYASDNFLEPPQNPVVCQQIDDLIIAGGAPQHRAVRPPQFSHNRDLYVRTSVAGERVAVRRRSRRKDRQTMDRRAFLALSAACIGALGGTIFPSAHAAILSEASEPFSWDGLIERMRAAAATAYTRP